MLDKRGETYMEGTSTGADRGLKTLEVQGDDALAVKKQGAADNLGNIENKTWPAKQDDVHYGATDSIFPGKEVGFSETAIGDPGS